MNEAEIVALVKRAIRRKKYRYPINIEAAVHAIRFIQNLRHTKGIYWGKPFILTDWQRDDIIIPLFGTLNPDGTRQYRFAYIEVPRKNGKSELAAAVALLLLFGDGEMSAEIYGAATERDQAAIVFGVAAQMVKNDAKLYGMSRVFEGRKRITVPSTDSFYHAISSEAASKHGYNAHGIIFDELHAQPSRDLWDVLTTSGGTRIQPLVMAITTAGYDRNSICYEQHDYAKKVMNGIIDDATYFAYIRAADEKDDWTDEKVWHKANPALGDFRDIEEMRVMAKKAKETPALENVFRRLYLNQWTQQETRYIPMNRWDDCGHRDIDKSKLAGAICYGGLDLSSSVDITALVFVFPSLYTTDTGESRIQYAVQPYFWIPKDTMMDKVRIDKVPYDVWEKQGYIYTTPGDVIDYDYIFETMNRLRDEDKYQMKEIAFDRWGAVQLSQKLDDAGFKVIPFGQGFRSMCAPTKDLLDLVLKQELLHANNPVLRWMADNMIVKMDAAGNVKPDKGKSTHRIDGMVALIMALDCAIRNRADIRSVYKSRGMRVM